jgi:ABC-type amino acid transport substrate-binding protein
MKKITLAFITLFALLFIGCTSEDKNNVSTKEVIKVGTSGGYFPFTFFEQDKLQGFEIDVWNAIAQKMDVTVEFKTSKFSGLFGMLETGKIDTISNQITMTDKRIEKYNFTTPYVYDGAQLVVHQDTNNINSLEDLKGKKLGVGLGTNYADIVKSFDPSNHIEIITYEGNGFEQDVNIKRIDAFIQDRVSSVEMIKKSKLPLKLVGEPIETLQNSFPFLKNEKNTELLKRINLAIETLRDEGTLKNISMKWFNTDITSK